MNMKGIEEPTVRNKAITNGASLLSNFVFIKFYPNSDHTRELVKAIRGIMAT